MNKTCCRLMALKLNAHTAMRGSQTRFTNACGAAVLFVAGILGSVGSAGGQEYPSRQIVLIVPFPAGGSTDALARIIAEPMRALLGQSVVIQNVAGAGATIGVGRAIQSTPDGYTLSIGNWTSHVGGSAVYKVPWNVLSDLEPVAMLSISSLMIVGRTGLPANDGKEFIAWLKANPDKATAATVGAGSGAHICASISHKRPVRNSATCPIAAARL